MSDKRFLKDLTKEELGKVLEVNKKLEDEVLESWCETCMVFQEEDGRMFNLNGVRYHDHYDSFFHTLTSYREFIENLNSEMLGEESQQKHKECEDMLNKLYNMDMYDEKFDKLENQIEEKAKSLLKEVDEYLYRYESMRFNKEAMINDFVDNVKYFNLYDNVYIDENYKAYEHIDYIKTY